MYKDNKNLLTKIPCELIFGIKSIIMIILAFTVFSPLLSAIPEKNLQKTLNNLDTKNYSSADFQRLSLNSASEYNFLTKAEIYSIRKKYVSRSIFNTPNYEPNENVFGQIVDGKPWWNFSGCKPENESSDFSENIIGESKVSKLVNNPNVLVGLITHYVLRNNEKNRSYCESSYKRFEPYSLLYNEKNKFFVAKYKVGADFLKLKARVNGQKIPYEVQLSGLNALDFGYKYIFVSNKENLYFVDYNDNASKEVRTFSDYIHLGNSCKYEGGCNNISPMQRDKTFYVHELPAQIDIKLWKNQPANKYAKADIYYRIIIEQE